MKKKGNYESDTENKMNLDQANDKYLLQLQTTIKKKIWAKKFVDLLMYSLLDWAIIKIS